MNTRRRDRGARLTLLLALLLNGVSSGSDGLWGIDGLIVGCSEGQRQCT